MTSKIVSLGTILIKIIVHYEHCRVTTSGKQDQRVIGGCGKCLCSGSGSSELFHAKALKLAMSRAYVDIRLQRIHVWSWGWVTTVPPSRRNNHQNKIALKKYKICALKRNFWNQSKYFGACWGWVQLRSLDRSANQRSGRGPTNHVVLDKPQLTPRTLVALNRTSASRNSLVTGNFLTEFSWFTCCLDSGSAFQMRN